MAATKEDVWQKSLNSCDLQHERHREFVLENFASENKVWSSLVFKDERGGSPDTSFYKIPLGQVIPQAYGTGSKKDNVIIPLLPMVYSDVNNDKFEAVQVRPGYIYVFLNDYLWRELKVVERSYMRDVNLTEYQNMSYREAFGERDSRLAVPYKIDGKEQKIEICFSEVQWSWDYINTMGGMNPDDPRLKSNTRMPTGSQKSHAATRRSKRMQELANLGDYMNGFTGGEDIVNINKTKKTIHRQINLPSSLGAVFLYDPIGVATNLKSSHIEKAFELEILSEAMTNLDYPLAKVLGYMLDSEDTGVKSDKGSSDKIKSDLRQTLLGNAIRASSSVGLGAQKRDSMIDELLGLERNASDMKIKGVIDKYIGNKKLNCGVSLPYYGGGDHSHILSVSETNEYVDKFIKQYKKSIYDQTPLAQVIDTERVKKAKKDWEEHDDTVQKEAEHAGLKTVQYLKDNKQKVSFETAMMDYLENTSSRFAQGMALTTYFIEYFENIREGVLYIKDLAEKNNEIGKRLCDPVYLNPHRKILTALENETIHKIQLTDDGFKITSELLSELTNRALNTVSKLLEGLAKVKIAEGDKGLVWLSEWLKSCLETETVKSLGLKIKEESINILYRPQKNYKKHIYRYLPDSSELFDKNKVKYLSIEKTTPNQIFDAFQNDRVVKSGFLVLNGVLQIINLANAYNKLVSIKPISAKDKVSVAGALVGVIDFGTQVATMLLSAKEGYLNAAIGDSKSLAQTYNKVADNSLRKRTDKKRVRKAKYNAAKSRANLFKRASEVAMKNARSIRMWTRVASVSSRVLGVVGGVLFYTEMVLELREQKNMGGVIGVGMKTAGGTMSLFVTYKTIRWIVSAARAGALGVTMMGAGIATAEFGVGIIIFIIGVIVTIIGETLLKEYNRPQLLKALDYCYFGKHPYGEGKLITDNPYQRDQTTVDYYSKEAIARREEARPYTYDVSRNWHLGKVMILYDIDFNAEIQEIYNALFSFKATLDIAKIVDSKSKKHTGEYVVRCHIYFGQFLEASSLMNCNLHFIRNYNGGTKQLHFPELKKKEIVENGELTQLKIFYKLSKKEATDFLRMEMFLRLDIHGDQTNQVPKSEDYCIRLIPRYAYTTQSLGDFHLEGARTLDSEGNIVPLDTIPTQSKHEVDEAYKS